MNKIQILQFLIKFVDILGTLLVYAIIGRVLISWFTLGQQSRGGQISQVIHDVTDPVMNLAKKIPHTIAMIDLSPIIALISIDILKAVVIIGLSNLI